MNSEPQNPNIQLLDAYLDGEMSAEEAAQFEKEIQNDSKLRELHDRWVETRSAFQGLKRFQLSDSFASQVLSRIETECANSIPETELVSDQKSIQWWAVGMIATLAAVVLIILSVAPSASVHSVPVAKDQVEADQNDSNQETSNVEDNKPQETQSSPRRPMIREPLAMRLKSRDRVSGEVGANKLMLDQVLLVSFPKDSQDPMGQLKKSLSSASHQIQIMKPEGGVSDQDPSALVVIASGSELKQILEELAQSDQIAVQAVSLEAQKFASDLESAAQQSISSAVAVPMIPIVSPAGSEIDPQEAKSLDDWFGLSALPQGDQLRRFLILVR